MSQIAVIIPAYNAEKYLSRAVESVLGQSFSDFCLLLIDDGSQDATGAICDAFAAGDARIQVLHRVNQGVCAARNAGLDWVYSHTDCRWIFFLDSDDWIHPETFARLVAAAEERGTKITLCQHYDTQGEQAEISPETLQPELWTPRDYYLQHFMNATVCWGKLWHRDCWEKLRFPLRKYVDDEFLLYQLLFSQEQLTMIPAPLYAYFINPAGISKKMTPQRCFEGWEAYEAQIAFFEGKGMEDVVHFRYSAYLDNTLEHYRAAQKGESAAILRKMRKRIRNIIKRMLRRGYLIFSCNIDLLLEFYPISTRILRYWKEKRGTYYD